MTSIAIIIPALNEGPDIENSLQQIMDHLKGLDGAEFTLIVVDDGSTDDTAEVVRRQPGVRLLRLSRHFGKEAAIYAGLSSAREFDAAIVMDSDLQHPPQLIGKLIEQWRQGYLVAEAVKTSRGREPALKGLLVRIYYRLFNFFTTLSLSGGTDFKLLDRRVVRAYCDLPEHNRFFRGLVRWMNFPNATVPFEVPVPGHGRASSWGGLALLRYAVSSITSFTAFPLQIVTLLGGVTFLLSLIIGGIALADKLSGNAIGGFTTVILLILIIGSILMFSVGLIGIYVGKIYDEVKRRPKYMIDHERSNLDGS